MRILVSSSSPSTLAKRKSVSTMRMKVTVKRTMTESIPTLKCSDTSTEDNQIIELEKRIGAIDIENIWKI
jgi:hypothetical protein